MATYVLIGLLIGLVVGALVGVVTGAIGAGITYCVLIGCLGGWVYHLSSRLKSLESSQLPHRSTHRGEANVGAVPAVQASLDDAAPPKPPESPPEVDAAVLARPAASAETVEELVPTPVDRLVTTVKDWFTTGNVPVKVGVVVSLFGVAFLINYAIEHELFSLPIWVRLVGVALFGAALFAIGWRVRRDKPVYGLSLQGGGMAVLYLTTYAAFGFYALLPAALAFGVMVLVTAATGLVAVLQDSRVLVVLGVAGGFAAPLLASTGEGDHVVLFSYYAVLNAAILTIAWFKAWRVLNLLGFGFTFVIASFWGYQGYRPEHFATTEPFLVLFVLMYIGIAVLFARSRPPNLRGFVDSAIVFGPPLIGFGLQTQLVESESGLAGTAGGLAALYATLAATIGRTRDLRMLAWSFAGLALLFLTAAFPLALDERWTSVAWATQGAMLCWFGMRNGRVLLAIAGSALQVVAAVAYVRAGVFGEPTVAVLNGQFLGAALLAVAGWIVAWSYDHGTLDPVPKRLLARLALGWGALWWVWAGLHEIVRFADDWFASALLGFVALSVVSATLAAGMLNWQRLNALALLLLPTMAALSLVGSPHPSADFGWVAWPFALGVQYGFLRYRERGFPRLTPLWQLGSYWVLVFVVAKEVGWLVDIVAHGDWPLASAVATALVLALAVGWARSMLPWPLEAHGRAYTDLGVPVVAGVALLVISGASLLSAGDAAPLPYLPVANPLAVGGMLALIAAWFCLDVEVRRRFSRPLVLGLAGVGLVLLTTEVARSVHQFAGVPFNLADLGRSATFQAGLSLVWGGAGLAGMIVGAVRERREVWIGGALVMAVVIVKLFLVELGNAGTVGRVVSFLGVGLLLLVVGYFAPVPKGRRVP